MPFTQLPHQNHCVLLQAELIKQGEEVTLELQLPLPAGAPVGALGTVLERSRQLCLQMYEKQLFSEQAAEQAYNSSKLGLSATQQGVYAGRAPACKLVLPMHGGPLSHDEQAWRQQGRSCLSHVLRSAELCRSTLAQHGVAPAQAACWSCLSN